jgi:hypothetical protein
VLMQHHSAFRAAQSDPLLIIRGVSANFHVSVEVADCTG